METSRSEVRLPSGSEVEGALLHGPWHDRVTAVRSGARAKVTAASERLLGTLRANPVKWAGIAAGAGFGLGLIGRMIRYRLKSRGLPEVVVIDAC
jgi:hypothetical protein